MTNADQSPIDMTVYHVRVFTLRTTGEHVGEYVHLADHGSTLTLDAWLETEANAGFSLDSMEGVCPSTSTALPSGFGDLLRVTTQGSKAQSGKAQSGKAQSGKAQSGKAQYSMGVTKSAPEREADARAAEAAPKPGDTGT